jgi:hypothetical protein
VQIAIIKQKKPPRMLQSSTIGDGFPNGNKQNGEYTSDAQ